MRRTGLRGSGGTYIRLASESARAAGPGRGGGARRTSPSLTSDGLSVSPEERVCNVKGSGTVGLLMEVMRTKLYFYSYIAKNI